MLPKTMHRSAILPASLQEGTERNEKALLIVFRQDYVGTGDPELGKTLLQPYIQALCDLPLPPGGMLFYNTGVRLLTADSSVLALISQLQQKGCEMLACNLSLQQLGLSCSLAAGEISTLEIMLDRQLKADHILWP